MGIAAFERLELRRFFGAHIVGNPTNFATIQAAVNAASPGATINVDPGTYIEQVTINKQLTLRGTEAGVDARSSQRASNNRETIVTGVNSGGVISRSFHVGANDVVLDGFTVQGETSQSTSVGAGIVIAPGVSGTKILNNIVQNNVAGLYLANNSATDPCVIQRNVFRNNNNDGVNGGRAIYTDGGVSGGNLTNVFIDSNVFDSNYGGNGTTTVEPAIAFETQAAGKQSNIFITNNSFTDNGKSVLFFNTTFVIIYGNTVSGASDWYSGSLRFEGNNHYVWIVNNNITNNPAPGVAIDSSGVAGNSSAFFINYNNITNNGTNYPQSMGVVLRQADYDGYIDVRSNWWGSSSGPSGDGPGSGDGVYANAFKGQHWEVFPGGHPMFSPWSTSPNPTNVTSLPTSPAGLAAYPISGSQTQTLVTWSPRPGSPLLVKVERSTNGTSFTQVGVALGAAPYFLDSGLTAGTKYWYRVRAQNLVGDSAYSNMASTTTNPVAAPAAVFSDTDFTTATRSPGDGDAKEDDLIAAAEL